MPHLALTFLGTFQAQLDGDLITLHTVKERALLAYLASESARPHQREALMALLWPDDTPRSAQQNLRQVLYLLRRTLGDTGSKGSPPFLLVTRQTVQFNPASSYTLDLKEFLHQIEQGQQEQAVALYQGQLLAGLLSDSLDFEEWLFFQREWLHNLALEALAFLTQQALVQRNYNGARTSAQRLLALAPWREEAHQQLMQILAVAGERSAALAQFETCRRILAAELGVEPAAETLALRERIRRGELASVHEQTTRVASTPQPAAEPRQVDWGEIPLIDHFYGRQQELARLTSWLVDERCRLVTILGMGGQGKTMLATRLVRELASMKGGAKGALRSQNSAGARPASYPHHCAPFDSIIWRSLLNAPPLVEILAAWVRFLSDQSISELPPALDAQFTLLLDLLRQQRCLLVLDNVESILQSGQESGEAGAYLPGYEDYEKLFQRLALSEHKSCLLLTSREQWPGVARLGRDTRFVRAFPLSGLDGEAGQAILQEQGLFAPTELTNRLVQRYSGNPLALKLIPETVRTFFDGDLAAFLAEEPLIFDDIRAVLDQQFKRLSNLEQAAIFWLAIERGAVSRQDQSLRLWDVHSGYGMSTLHGHTDAVTAVAFSSNEKWLASASRDETIHFWDIETKERLKTLRTAGPYAGMKISGITGITEAQKAALKALGAVE